MRISFSVISHGQGDLVEQLLGDFARLKLPAHELLVTLNIREDEAFLSKHSELPIRIIRNHLPRGFGANHNRAFEQSSGDVFVILNPDVRLRDFDISMLLALLTRPGVGLVAPAVYSSKGELQDSARKFPTMWTLFGRKFGRSVSLDYAFGDTPFEVDWVAGMFMLVRREVFAKVGGFDERFYMYFEDADLCRRIAAAGLAVIVEPRVSVIHDAQRASRRDARHIRWHLISAFRYLTHV